MRNVFERTSVSRQSLLAGCALASAMAVSGWADTAHAQTALQGNPTVVAGIANINRTAALDTISVFAPETVINWSTFDNAIGGGPIVFLNAGSAALFQNDPDFNSSFTVLNRILPNDATRAIRFDGTIQTRVNGNAGGSVWFYSPGGLILGPTAFFDVGNLVLSANDIDFSSGLFTGPGSNTVLFRGAAGSTSGVEIQNGARISAQLDNSYVAVVAPRITQSGSINVDGSALLLAAEQADVQIDAGLFGIGFTVGTSAGGNAIVHDGSTTGPNPTNFNDRQQIIVSAIAKNDAVTALVGGTLGYSSAQTAFVDAGTVVLSADTVRVGGAGTTITSNAEVFANNAIVIGDSAANTRFVRNTTLTSAGDITISPRPGFSVDFGLSLVATASRRLEFNADAGERITVGGSAQLFSENIGAGSGVFARAVGTGGLISVGNDLRIDGGGSFAGSEKLADAQLLVDGGTLTVGGNIDVDAADDVTQGFDGARSGAASFTIVNNAQVTAGGDLSVRAAGTTNFGFGQGPAAAGTAGLVVRNSTLTAGDVSVDSGSIGTLGTDSVGGNVSLLFRDSIVTLNSLQINSGASVAVSGSPPVIADGLSSGSGVSQLNGDAFVQGGTARFDVINSTVTLNAGLSLTADANGVADGAVEDNVLGGSAILNIDTGTLTTASLTMSADAFANGTPPGGVAISSTGGSASITTTNAGLTVNASTNISASATGAPGGPTRGGTIAFVNAGTMQFNDALTANATAQGVDGGAAVGGTITIANNGAFASENGAFLDASAFGGSGPVSGSGTGGTITLTSPAGSSLALRGAATSAFSASGVGGNANSAEDPDLEVVGSGTGQGGTISVILGTTGGASTDFHTLLNVSLAASGSVAKANGTTETFGGAGGVAIGGDATLDIRSGNVTSNSISINANGFGGDGGNANANVAAGSGGNATGGNARLLVSSTDSNRFGSVSLTARADGGLGGNASIAQAAGAGGFATGGLAAYLNSGASGAMSLTIATGAAGGGGGNGSDAFAGGAGGAARAGTSRLTVASGSIFDAISFVTGFPSLQALLTSIAVGGRGGVGAGTMDGGAGGQGIGGNLTLDLVGQFGTNGDTSLTIDTSATGGEGGGVSDGQLGGGPLGTGGAGGLARGGDVTLNVLRSALTLAGLTITTTAQGGAGGSISEGGATATGGRGGNASAGNVRFAVDVDPDIGDLEIRSDAFGGTGGDAVTGGAGGDAINSATVTFEVTDGITNVNDAFITADAQGGSGGRGLAGTGGAGGNATAGTALIAARGPTSELNITTLSLSTTGAGGTGGASISFSTPGDGGAGGNGTGGSATVITTGGGKLALTGSSNVSAAAGGGGGGQGSPGSTPGAGGAGGSAVAGSVLVDGTDGILNINQFSSDASGSGGTGGMGGETGYGSGPGTVAGGGRGGNVTVREVGFTSVDSTLFAFAEGDGGLGGNGSVGGNAGNGVGGTVVVSLTNPTGTLGQLVASASASGGSGGDGLGGNGGNATGGTATVTLTTPDAGFVIGQSRVDASATGGNAASGGISGSGGNGTAGTANLTLSGGALSGTASTLRAIGTGGVANNGSGNRGGPGTNGGTGGSGSGGTINLVVNDGAALTLSGDPGLVADATGTGQAGGSGGTGAGVAGVGGAGGSGTGGRIFQTFADGATLALSAVEAIINMTASGVGGAGGLGGRFGSSGGNGGAGGAGIGGSGTLNLTGANTSIPNGRSITMTLNGTAGAGGEAGVDVVGSIGGAGGLARGGNATLSLSSATAGLGELNFAVSATAGAGGNGGTGGGGAGGAATGGNIVVDAIDGASLTLATQSLSANATGGAGGSGSAAGAPGGQAGAANGTDGNPGIQGDRGQDGQNGLAGLSGNTGGAGGLGGDATGGAVTLRATGSSLTTGAVTVGASGTAGRGGAGGDGSAGGRGGDAGNGGNGSNAFSDRVAGGAGGNGGVGGIGGRGGNGGVGGNGGAGVGGSIRLTPIDGTLTTGNLTLTANGSGGFAGAGGNGGAGGLSGNGGSGGNGGSASGLNARGGAGGNGGASGTGGTGGDGAFPGTPTSGTGGAVALIAEGGVLTTGSVLANVSGSDGYDFASAGGSEGAGGDVGAGGGAGAGGPGTPFGANGIAGSLGAGGSGGVNNRFVFGGGGSTGGTIDLRTKSFLNADNELILGSFSTGALNFNAEGLTDGFGSIFNSGRGGGVSIIADGGTTTIASLSVRTVGSPQSGGDINLDAGGNTLAITGDAILQATGSIIFGASGNGGLIRAGGALSAGASNGGDVRLDSGNVQTASIDLLAGSQVLAAPETLFDAGTRIGINAGRVDVSSLRAPEEIIITSRGDVNLFEASTTAAPDVNNPFPIRPGIIQITAGFVDLVYINATATIGGTINSTGDTIINSGGDIVIQSSATINSNNRLLLSSGDDIIINPGAVLISGRNPIPETGYGATGQLRVGAGVLRVGAAAPGEVASFIAGGSLTAIDNLIDISAEAIDAGNAIFDAGRFQALISNAPAPGAPPLDDSGQLSANCVMGNACLGQVTATFNGEFINATGEILIGPETGTAGLANRVFGLGSLNGNIISIRARDQVDIGDLERVTRLSAQDRLFVASINGDVNLIGETTLIGGSNLALFAGGSISGDSGVGLLSSGNVGLGATDGVDLASVDVGGVLQTVDGDGNVTDANALFVPGTIAINNLVVRGGDAALNSFSDISVNTGSVTAGSLFVLTDGNATFGSIDAATSIGVRATTVTAASLTAGEDITLRPLATVDIGSASAGDDFEIFDATGVTVGLGRATGLGQDGGELIFGANAISIARGSGDGADINFTGTGPVTLGDLIAANDILIDTTGTVRATGLLQTTGNAPLGGDSDIEIFTDAGVLVGAVDAFSDFEVFALNFNATGSIHGGEDVEVNTSGAISAANITAGDDVRLNSTTGNISFGSAIASGAGPDDEAGGADVRIRSISGAISIGAATATDEIDFASGGNISAASLTTSGTGADADLSNVVLDSGGIVNAGTISANAAIAVRGASVTGTSWQAGEAIAVRANGNIGLGSATAGEGLSISGGGNLVIDNAVALGTGARPRDIRFLAGIGNIDIVNTPGTVTRALDVTMGGSATIGAARADLGSVTLDAAAISGGPITAGDDLVLNSAGPISVGALRTRGVGPDVGAPGSNVFVTGDSISVASIDAAGGVELTGLAGPVVSNGTILAGGSVDVTGVGLTLADVTAGTGISLFGTDGSSVSTGNLTGLQIFVDSGDTVSTGNIVATGGNIRIAAINGLNLGDLSALRGSVVLDNFSGSIFAGVVTVGNDFTLTTASDVDLAGVTVGDDIRINSSGNATYGRLIATGSGVDDDADGLGDGSNIDLFSGGSIELVHAESANDFTATANRFETGNNSIITDGDIIIDTVGDSILGTSRAGGLISVNAGGLISFSSLTSALTTDLSGNVVSGNVAQAGGGFTANATGQLSASNVASTRDSILLSSSNGPVNLGLATAAGDVRVFSGGLATIASATAGGDVRVRGLGAVRVGNAVARGTFINGQNQTSEGHVFVIADGMATVDSANAASMLGISGASVNGSAVGTLRAGEDILVVANGPVSLGNLSAGDDIDINVPGAITLTSATSRGDARDDRALAFVNLRGGPQFQIQTATPDGSDVRLTATGASGTINLGTANAANDLLLNASASLGSTGLLSAGGAVSLSAGVGGVNAGSRITVQDINAGTTISLNSTNSGVMARNLAAGSGIATTGFDISAVNSATTATGDIAITDTNSVFVQAAVASTGSITLSGGGSGTIIGNNLTAARDITVSGASAATLANAQAGDDIRVTTSATIDLGVISTTGLGADNEGDGANIVMSAPGQIKFDGLAGALLSAAGNVSLTSSQIAGGNRPVTAGRAITLNGGNFVNAGALTAGADIIATAVGDIALSGGGSAGGSITARGGSFSLSGGPLASRGSINIVTSSGNLTLSTPVNAGGALLLDSANFALFNALSGNGITITARNAIVGGSGLFTGPGTLDSTGSVTLNSDVGIAISGAISAAGAITGTAPGFLLADATGSAITLTATTGGLSAANLTATGGAVTLDVAGAVTTGDILASGDAVVARSSMIDAGNIASTNGDVSLTSAGTITTGDLTAANGSVGLTNTNGPINTGTITARNDFTINTGSELSFGGVSVGDDIRITTTGNATLGRLITTGAGTDNEGDGSNIRIVTGLDTTLDHAEARGSFSANARNFATGLNSIITGGSIVINAVNGADLGNSTAGTFIDVSANNSVRFASLISGSETFLRGDNINGGTSTAGTTISVRGGDIAVASLTADGDVLADADRSLSIGSATARGTALNQRGIPFAGNVFVTAQGPLTLNNATARTFIGAYATNNGALSGSSTWTAGEDIVARTDGTGSVTLATLSAGDDIRIDTTGAATIGSLTARGDGREDRTLAAVVNPDGFPTFTVTDTPADGADITLNLGTTATIANLTAGDDISVTSNGAFTLSGFAQTRGTGTTAGASDITISAASASLAASNAFSNLTATTAGDLDLGTSRAGGAIVANANGALRFATLNSGDVTRLRAFGGAITGESATAGSDFDANGNGGASIGTVTAGGSATISAGGSGIALGSIDAAGNINLIHGQGQAITASLLNAGGDIRVDGTGSVTIDDARARGTFAPNGVPVDGNVFIYADGVATLNSATARSNIGVRGAGVSGSGSWVAGEDIRVLSTAGATLGALSAGDDLTLETVDQLTVASGTTTGAGRDDRGLTLFSGEGGRGWQSRSATAGGADIFLTSSADSVAAGNQLSDDDLTITAAAGSVSIGIASAGGNLTAQAGAGPLTANGPLSAGGIAQLVGTEIGVGNVAAGANVSATSSGGSLTAGNIAGGTGVALSSAGALTTTNVASTTSNIAATAVGTAQMGMVTAAVGDVTLTAGGGVTIVAADAGGDLRVTAPTLTASALRASDDITVTTTGNATLGSVTGRGTADGSSAVSITAPSGIAIETMNVIGTVALNAASGAIVVSRDLLASGAVTANGRAIDLVSSGALNLASALATDGNIRVTAGSLTASDAQARGDLSLTTTSGDLVAGVLRTGTSVGASAGGTPGPGDISLTSARGAALDGMANAQRNLSVVARNTLAINALASGNAVDLRSGNIAIAATAAVGEQGRTTLVRLTNSANAVTTIGGAGSASGYSLSNAEAQRIFANDIIIVAPRVTAQQGSSTGQVSAALNTRAPDVILDTLTLTGANAQTGATVGNIGTSGRLRIETPGKLRTVGAVTLNNLGSGNRFQIAADEAIEVDAATGSISLRNAQSGLGGVLELSSADVIAATIPAISGVIGAPTTEAASDLLGASSGSSANDDGFLRADAINVTVSGGFYVQNSGAPSTNLRNFDDRRGLTVGQGGLSINTTSASTRIIVNGRQQSAGSFVTGLDFLRQVVINGGSAGLNNLVSGRFDAQSTINGCAILSVAQCNVSFDNGNIARDIIRNVVAEENGEGDGGLLPFSLVQVKDVDPLPFQPVIDDPVTGSGNDDLWAVDDGKDCPEGETCAN